MKTGHSDFAYRGRTHPRTRKGISSYISFTYLIASSSFLGYIDQTDGVSGYQSVEIWTLAGASRLGDLEMVVPPINAFHHSLSSITIPKEISPSEPATITLLRSSTPGSPMLSSSGSLSSNPSGCFKEYVISRPFLAPWAAF